MSKSRWCALRGWLRRTWFYIDTGRYIEDWDGHDWERWRDKPVWNQCMYHSTLHAKCRRCGMVVSEPRWGFVSHSGSLTWIRGGEAGDAG